MERSALWMVAGPNGAGKTTLANQPRFKRLLHAVPFLNPDQRALEKLRAAGRKGFHDASVEQLRRCFIEAAEDTERELRVRLAAREAVGVETVLSTRKYCSVVEEVLAAAGGH